MKNLFLAMGIAGIGTPLSLGQTINFVDADETNCQIGGAPLSLGVNYTSPDRPTSDDLWAYDDDSNFANPTTGGAIWACGSGDTVAELSQTLTGLTPGTAYVIYAFGWTAGSTWDMAAGLISGNLTEYRDGPSGEYFALANRFDSVGSPVVFSQANIFGETKTFSPAIEGSEGNRDVYVVRLGWAVAPAGGEVTGFIKDYPGGDRTWFDGLGYEELNLNGDDDGDGLTNGDEINVHSTEPFVADSDEDGFDDGTEVNGGSDPNDPLSVPDAAESKTYVDAQHTTPGATGYTTLADGSPFTPEPEGVTGADNLWELRDNGGSGFGNTSVYESNGENGEDVPRLATTITGLTPGGLYQLYANFWSAANATWHLRAGLEDTAGDLEGFIGNNINGSAFTNAPPINLEADSLGSFTDPPLDGIADANGFDGNNFFTNAAPLVRIEEGNRDMYLADLGGAFANQDGEITVYIDDLANTVQSSRTWYDGVSFIQRPFDLNADSDGDGLTNGDELNVFNTDPFNPNSDGDLYDDLEEVSPPSPLLAGDPNDPAVYPIHPDGLFVDFSSDGSDVQQGPEHNPFYQPYIASHEIDSTNQTGDLLIVDRSEAFSVPGFSGSPTVTLGVAYPDPVPFAPTVKQMIGRNDIDIATYEGEQLSLMRDWLGIDPRLSSGGNGTAGDFGPSHMTLTFSGLPSGTYQYRGYHHDTQNIGSCFDIGITDSGRTDEAIGSFRMTRSNDFQGPPYQPVNPGSGNSPVMLPSTIEFLFTSNGIDDVVVEYAAIDSGVSFTKAFFGVNGLEITPANDADGDGIPDSDDANPGVDDATLDSDGDNLSNLEEWILGTDPDEADTDGDGLEDDVETNTSLFVGSGDTGSSPFNADSDGDGGSDGDEVALGLDPNAANVFYTPPAGTELAAIDGVWTWFNDERAIWHMGKLYTGWVDSAGFPGISQYDPITQTLNRMVLGTASAQQVDDHNNPSITVRPDGTLLAIYSKHGTEQQFYYRISTVTEPDELADWGPELVQNVGANNTYTNAFVLTGESDTIYNFHRAINFNPTLSISTDNGATWGSPVHFIDTGNGGVRPYPQTVSNGVDRIDMIYTDGHPDAVVDNSIYHFYYESGAGVSDGSIRLSDGTVLDAGSDPKTLQDIIAGDPIDHDGDQVDTAGPERGTLVYEYNAAAYAGGDDLHDYLPGANAWTWDIDYDGGDPVCVFQTRLGGVTGTSGFQDDRIYYYYAKWTGTEWQKRLIAQGGRPIYSSQRWYGGGITIDPDDPNVVYISSNSMDPTDLTFNGAATGAVGDPYLTNTTLNAGDRYEIWRGVTSDGGLTFTWEQITVDSPFDNLRPIVPKGHGYDRHALWFYGDYNTFTNYSTAVVGLFETVVQEIKITDVGFVGSDFFIDVEGGVAGRKVTTGDDLDFTTPVDVPTTDDGANRFFIAPGNLVPGRDFFRVEDE